MVGTKSGGKKAAKTNIEVHGSDFYSRIGKLGGSKTGILKGFATMSKEKRSEAGRKGGKISKRGKAKK